MEMETVFITFLQTVRKFGFKSQSLFPKCLFSTPISQVNVIVRKCFNFFQWSWRKEAKALLLPYLNWSWHLNMHTRWSFWSSLSLLKIKDHFFASVFKSGEPIGVTAFLVGLHLWTITDPQDTMKKTVLRPLKTE